MKTKQKDKFEKVAFSYNVDVSQVEQENRMLREALGNLREEFEHLKQNPLMVCEIMGKSVI